MVARRKLIEVALPLEAINVASAREKSIRHGHPSTLHLWWAPRPLAACRAVLFASLVDDPSSDPERFPTPKAQEDERRRLFGIIEDLVRWENSTNEDVLERAREEIRRATGGNPPPVLDPFCGRGSIPLEAQRLGLTAYASDLNLVAVLITKALIEIPPKFAARPPVHPDARDGVGASGSWPGATGLAEDVRRYGTWMRDDAERRIGHLYPKVRLPAEAGGGGEATVIAWLWARTVRCPNPACGAQMPLVRSFALSTKEGKEAWVEPVVDRASKSVSFKVRSGPGRPPEPTKVGRRGASFRCLVCDELAPEAHVKAEGQAGRMGAQLMTIVAESRRGRVYVEPDQQHESIARSAKPDWGPDEPLAVDPRNIWCTQYGLDHFADLFTPRQLVALTTFSDLVGEARERVYRHAVEAGLPDDGVPLHAGGTGAPAYADAVATYLAFAVDRSADYWSSIATWRSPAEALRGTFARQAIPMSWDFAEANPLSQSTGSWANLVDGILEVVRRSAASSIGTARQQDAVMDVDGISPPLVCTDPPYYDNIGYADLSDFFYVWLRRSLGAVYPDLFRTVLTPKAEELVATPYRFGGDARKAETHFETGLRKAFQHIRDTAHPDYPVTIFYAFKQEEEDADDDNGTVARVSTGWEKMLEGLLDAGFSIDGTWPMRTERTGRMVSIGTNALASSIVLACRPRPADAGVTTRAAFLAALKRELPEALRTLQHGNIAPVDLAQAAIGPGMAVFSRYAKVLEPDGSPMRVRTALGLINAVLDEVLAEQEGEFDADTRFAVTWYSQHAFREGAFGDADVLARARDTAVDGLVRAGVVRAGGGKVALRSRAELDPDWDPATDRRPTVWEATQHLVRRLHEGGEAAAADLLARLGGLGDVARDLAYRLYLLAERKGWTDEALAYNALVVAWPRLSQLAEARRAAGPAQQALGLGG